MDFSFTEEQDDLRALAARILTDKLVEEKMREVEAGAQRFDRETWDALAAANLLGIALPEEVGGSGYGLLEQCIVLEQVGRTVAPTPVLASIVMGAAPIAQFGTPEQKKAYAAPAAEGQLILTAALVEPNNPWPNPPLTTASSTADGGYVVSGTKTTVPAGMLADRVLVPAVVDGAVSVFIVDTSAAGVTREAQKVTSKETEALLTLASAPAELLGTVGQGEEILAWLTARATLGAVAEQLGITSRALEMTADYAKTRVQFERPIATFQAVGQRCADAYIDVEGVRLTLWQAVFNVEAGRPADTEIEVAKFWACEAGHRVAHTAVHIHGGVGVDTDHPIHRYFVAAKRHEFLLGSATRHLLSMGARFARGEAVAGRA